jgi:hypothetical protein
MHPECRASLSIVENLIQYYPFSPGPVAVTLRVCSRSIGGHEAMEATIVARDGAEAPAISRSHDP